jgi:hypothetical protein
VWVLLFAPLLACPRMPTRCAAQRAAPLTLPHLELYTSEGCESCPPAERWRASTFTDARAKRAIALAFHVDYWDRLG